MATDRQRYTVSVTTEMFEAIEDFRFKHRYQTRSEATTELIRLGLEQLKKKEAEDQEKTGQEQIHIPQPNKFEINDIDAELEGIRAELEFQKAAEAG